MAASILTFDLQAGLEAKHEGIKAAALSRQQLLKDVRSALVEIAQARIQRTATADDAQQWLKDNGYSPADLGNAAGAIFTAAQWEFTGQWETSTRVTNHGHKNRIWKLL